MQIPVSAYSVGTTGLNPQGLNPQVIRNAMQPLALRKLKHTGTLFFAAAHGEGGATALSSLIMFPGSPAERWGTTTGTPGVSEIHL